MMLSFSSWPWRRAAGIIHWRFFMKGNCCRTQVKTSKPPSFRAYSSAPGIGRSPLLQGPATSRMMTTSDRLNTGRCKSSRRPERDPSLGCRALGYGDKTLRDRKPCQPRHAVYVELAHDVVAMCFHSARTDPQPTGNFFVAKPLGYRHQHFAFAMADLLQVLAVHELEQGSISHFRVKKVSTPSHRFDRLDQLGHGSILGHATVGTTVGYPQCVLRRVVDRKNDNL